MRVKTVKVPVVMQMEALECGAASLAMILAYYGRWVPLEQVRQDCGVSRDGSSAKNILQAARNYGLKAKGFRMELAGLTQATVPAIIHWNFNHFVVLNGLNEKYAWINDPARGTMKMTREEFSQSFTGIILQFECPAEFSRSQKQNTTLRFIRKRLQGSESVFLFIFLTGLGSAAIALVFPFYTRIFLDKILSGQNPDWFVPLLIATALTVIMQAALTAAESNFLLKVRAKFALSASASFLWHILRLPVGFYAQRFAGDIAKRQESNETIAETLLQKLAPVLLDLVMIVFYLGVMMRYSVLLALVGIIASLLNLVAMQLVARQRTNISRVLERDSGKLYGFTVSGIEMVETIKASGAESGYFEKWAGYHATQNNARVQFSRSSELLGAVPFLMQRLSNSAVLMLGVYLILGGQMTIGMLIAFQGFLAAYLDPMTRLSDTLQAMQDMQTRMERIEDVFNYPVDVKSKIDPASGVTEAPGSHQAKTLERLSGHLDIQHISFGYSKLSPPLIEDFSVTLKPGSRIAFVGSSGSGKSTLAKVIAGLYPVWSGEILFDGQRMADIDRSVFRGSVASVDQDISLFECSVAENITLWDPSIPEQTIVQASREAVLHEDILLRPEGYGMMVHEGGRNFSGGQRQRFEIARALAQDPSILILDEATSALDPKTELQIMDAVKSRQISCIIVAHRLSTIRDSDEIIMLEQGKVVERGTHEELLELGGAYARLIAMD